MAKMKDYLVKVEITQTHYFVVRDHSPEMAKLKLMTEEGWSEAIWYEGQVSLSDRFLAKAVEVREVG